MKINFILIALTFLFCQCSSYKKNLIQNGGKNEVIANTILDFSNNESLYKKGNIFTIEVVQLKSNDKLFVARVSENNSKILVTSETIVGSKGKMPSRYVEKDSKLFFWWDDDYALTEDAIEVYRKYNLLQSDEGGWIKMPDSKIDELQKSAHYYFCKSNLTNYKKVITNRGLGYYPAPKLDCDSNVSN